MSPQISVCDPGRVAQNFADLDRHRGAVVGAAVRLRVVQDDVPFGDSSSDSRVVDVCAALLPCAGSAPLALDMTQS